jgi:predicted HAD superfamily hydrolase
MLARTPFHRACWSNGVSGKFCSKMTKVAVRSFDIFDTLVARRCVHPYNIFYFVEHRASHEGFTKMRILAERGISNQDYNLQAIYRAMQTLFNIDSARLAALMQMELEEEFANLIPIRENCLLVAPGDLLVSDMYLPMSFLRRVVDLPHSAS